MDYEKAYKEALERAREFQKSKDGLCVLTAESIFPELQESEDERIRKELYDFIYITTFRPKELKKKERFLDWLEKQGERDARYENLEELLEADTIYQMAMNDAMVEGAKTKAMNALSGLEIGKLLGIEKQGEQKPTWSDEDERLRNSCIKHIEEELEEIRKDRFGHSEIISDLKEECRERINWLKSLKERLS